MAIDERRRQQMYRKLEELLGPDEAITLMEHLPPGGWGEVARRSDIDALRVATSSDIDALRVATDAFREATKSDIGSLRREMLHLEERLSDRFDAKLESSLNSQTKAIVGLMSAQVLAVAGLAFAAARLA